jgi:hypothetical protein
LDINGHQPFTLIAWINFIGKRHLVAGIWDEGGWDKYGGRRQIALFGGLFGSKGVIGHISATGASSYPQSTISGSQYARCRAIDGRGFDNGQWVSMAMTFDPSTEKVTVFCDGVATPTHITDPVAKDVFRHEGRGFAQFSGANGRDSGRGRVASWTSETICSPPLIWWRDSEHGMLVETCGFGGTRIWSVSLAIR